MKILLSGYYGFDNAGDDAVLFAIVQALREIIPDVDITVLSNQPEKTAQQFGVKAVDRWGKTSLPKAIKDCDVLISGGGSLLQDVTSKNGILYYLGVIKLAQMMRKKVIVYAQGIGPVNEPRNRALVAKILNKVQAITVRDFDSRRELMEMGVRMVSEQLYDEDNPAEQQFFRSVNGYLLRKWKERDTQGMEDDEGIEIRENAAVAIVDIAEDINEKLEVIKEYNKLIKSKNIHDLKDYSTIDSITGYASSCDEEPKLNNEQLKMFYKKHGFEINEKGYIKKSFTE